mmetsp:Transcript_22502/g.43726  ORF Transcript_22502/g.43726 Transcript_22502/m.43726 type:complete len:566 (-) Transcript_22502:670-2367(-)
MLTTGRLHGVSEEGHSGDAEGDIQNNPKALLAATAALHQKNRPGSSAIPGLKLGDLSAQEDEMAPQPGASTARKTPSVFSRMKNQALGSMTPRSSRTAGSGLFSARGRATSDGKKLFVTKTAKGSLVAASVMRITTSSGSNKEAFTLLVGDVFFSFMLAFQPELPLGLRLWPSQVICLNQSSLALPGYKPEVRSKDSSFMITSRQQGLGSVQLLGDDTPTMQRFALAMHLGVGNVRRSRQQAKLSLAQQLFHEKKLSLLKTQHMIELLHKSQEMFFEAGSGQFDDCNAVCMHSGTMRQSLIDVTPFMPVSDFICEYCSCVIILEEEAAKANEAIETRAEEHKAQLKKEQQKKLQLDDETLMVARDVRVLRQRRKLSEEESAAAWKKVQESIQGRQQLEAKVENMKMSQRLRSMDKPHVEVLRGNLQEQVAAARRQRDALLAQYNIRQARLAGVQADLDPEEELRSVSDKNNQSASSIGQARRQLAGNKKVSGAQGDAKGEMRERKASFGKSGGLTRVLSFGKRKKVPDQPASPVNVDPQPAEVEEKKPQSTTGNIVRKISFGRKK